MIFALSVCFVGVDAECDGQPCQLLSVSTPSRLEDPEEEGDPQLGTNTFTAVDQCANSEVSRLTNWILDYYADVSTQLDQSFSNILQIGRLAASALTHLSSLSAELQAYQRVANITSEMNAMLRTCLADYSALTNSMLKCPMAFDANSQVPMANLTAEENMGLLTERLDLNGTCLELLCEHIQTFTVTCGNEGFIKDLSELAAAHELEGTSSRYLSKRDSSFLNPPVHFLYTPESDSSYYAELAEDLLTQEYALMQRVQLVVDLWMRWMFVTVRKNLRGSIWDGAQDMEICQKLGFEPPLPYYHLVVKLETCDGGKKIRDILLKHKQEQVVPFVRNMLNKMNEAMNDKIIEPNNIVYGGKLTNICAQYKDDWEPLIDEQYKLLQQENEAMGLGPDSSGSVKDYGGDKFMGSTISKVGDPAVRGTFGPGTGNIQHFGMNMGDNMPGL